MGLEFLIMKYHAWLASAVFFPRLFLDFRFGLDISVLFLLKGVGNMENGKCGRGGVFIF